MKEKIYVFQWISDLGGADTRLKELLILLKDRFDITCVPNDDFRLQEKHNTDFLDKHGISYVSFSSLPKQLSGYAYSNCNFRLFSERNRIEYIKDSGLKLLWSNDMMWHTPEEILAIKKNMIEVVLYTSAFHRSVLHKEVASANPTQKTFVIENYFDADTWPLLERKDRGFTTFGKVSRDEPMKFSENFPIFYDQITDGLKCEYSILGWSDKVASKYKWYNFEDKWRLYAANAMATIEWFADLDVFLYNCNHKFIENQSRAIIESQLTGAPNIAPNKWNFPNIIQHEETGFVWNNLDEAKEQAKILSDYDTRTKMGRLASQHCRDKWCNKVAAISKWSTLLDVANKRIEVNV